MKKMFSIIAAMAFVFAANAQNYSDLIISKYFEGPKGNNKVVEIYNGTGAEVSLSGYVMKLYNVSGDGTNDGNINGWIDSLVLSGTLANGACYIIAHASADASFTEKANINITGGGIAAFNGNDAVGLFKNSTLLDIIGKTNVNESWGKDLFFTRNCDVTAPAATWNPNEWTSQTATEEYATFAEQLGTHCGTAPVDETAPTLVSVIAKTTTSIVVTFNEVVTAATAEVAGNYIVNGGVTVSAASLASKVVTLTVSELTSGASYTLTVTGVSDVAGNVMSATNMDVYNPTFTEVSDIAELWDAFFDEIYNESGGSWNSTETVFTGTTVYKLTDAVAVTALGSQRGQKWVQDYSASDDGYEYGVLIDDPNSKITSDIEVGNTLTGLTGTCVYYYDLIEFVPADNIIPDATPAFEVEPLEVELDMFGIEEEQETLWAYQSCLVKLPNVYFKDNVTLANGLNYAMCNVPNGTANDIVDSAVRTHIYNKVTYTANNTRAVDVMGVLVIDKLGMMRVSPRTTADISGNGIANEKPTVARKNVALQLSPIPVKDVLNVSMNDAVSVNVYALNGTPVAEKHGINGKTTINVASFASGIYLVKATDKAGKISIRKFIKK